MPAKRARLDPVSCQLCRSKKLRCSRQHPCSNCSARGVTCIYAADPPPQYRSAQTDDPTVNARLKRLEEAVEALSKSALPPLTPSSADSPAAALDWLEDAGIKASNQHVRASDQAGGLSFAIVQIEGSTEALPSHSFLPAREETLRLFAHYNKQVGYLHHIIHTETTLATIHQIYAALPDRMNHASAALLLAILASATHFWDPTVGIFASAGHARGVSRIWLAEALKTLDQSRCADAPAVEDVQATIIASYLAYNMQGYSAQFRLLQTTALELARQASLHKTDAPPPQHHQHHQQPPRDLVADEVKRRVWWHIVATDWLLAFTSGPQEGTYLVQPRHMSVSHPLHAFDGALSTPLPLASAPTTMTFALLRLRFATICRTIADALPPALYPFDLRRADPATVRRLDGLFEGFLEGLPGAFRIDGGGEAEGDVDVESRIPRLATQRYLIHLCAHVRRCKLHQPWLVLPRGAEDSERAFSRRTCLESARKVVGVAQLFEADEQRRRVESGGGGAGEGRLSTVVHHVAMAAVVLVVDLCFSGDELRARGEREGRRREIGEACRVLERARKESEMAARFLKSLGEMLRRHGVELRVVAEEDRGDVVEVQNVDVGAGGGDAEFEALLQNCANTGGDVDFSGWEDVFASFDSYPAMIDLAF
ncbi:hypothetical protein SLS58_010563 [Diplodia intermedia]|uniref:Zn(2)-C6 fungal-type domain-containing protein n=1 Tax=Diplodia intermedia TaxID=856260 RepID=A0ABR3T542_9PEZI